MRPCKIFLQNRGKLLGNHGYESDPVNVNRTDDGIAFYHYTHRNNLEQILRGKESGLHARLPLLNSDRAPEFEDCYIADYAHVLEWKHILRRGGPALNLGYDVSNGRETTQADIHSYISASEYVSGHVAPVLKIIRKGKGIAIPKKYITISEEQPFKDTSDKLPYRYLKKIHGISEEIIRQIDTIDKIVYGVTMYKIKKNIFPESIDKIAKVPEDLRKKLCFPGSEYDIPVEFLYSKKFDVSKDNSTCFVHFDSKKIMFYEIKKYFIRPNFMVDDNYLVYRISIKDEHKKMIA